MTPTTNNVAGFADYTGPSDPREIRLAIWTARTPVLKLVKCESVHITDLRIQHGTKRCGWKCTDVRLDHVTVLAGPHGVDIAESSDGCMLTDCVVDGGMPPWYSQRPQGRLSVQHVDKTFTDGLGEGTLRALLEGHGSCTNTRIRQCDFRNGHDLLLFGTTPEFSRNWIFNLNDDALFAETLGNADTRIFENVMEQCLTQ